jgi:hypothetical protein
VPAVSIPTRTASEIDRAFTIRQFCLIEKISPATYAKLKRRGLGPREDEIIAPGVRIVRISPEARDEWKKRMTALRESKTAQVERERAHQQRIEAGRRSAASDKHVSKRARCQRGRRRK